MEINSIFSFLRPKENKFFPMINNVGDVLVKAGEKQVSLINSKSREEIEILYHAIKDYETQSDTLTANIYEELNDAFITPFDREDIHNLCESVDDTLDYINSTAKRILLFKPARLPEVAIKMSEIIYKCTIAIDICLKELRTINKKPELALSQCDILHDLEQEADELYENFVRDLFETETDIKEVIKNKEIMQHMEKTTDMAKHVSKVVKTIIVKYA